MIFNKGDFITLVIPSNNCTPLDAKRMAVKIVKVLRADIYILQYQFRVLDQNVGTASLNIMHEDVARQLSHLFNNASLNFNKKITLHKAAAMMLSSDYNTLNYNCKKGYTTKRYNC